MREMRWTPEQARALTHRDDALLMANAGTGKTTTIVGKILWLLGLPVGVDGSSGEPIPPCPPGERCRLPEVAAITFTEKAAHDLKETLRREIEAARGGAELRWELDRAAIGTIHSFAGGLLRENALRLGLDPTFRVLDERESRAELDRISREVILAALDADEEGVGDIYRAFKLEGYTHQPGTVDLVRDALRDLRWHAERYAGWRSGGRLDPEALRARAGPAGWSEGADDLGAAHCDALLRLATRVRDRWEAFQDRENARDFDALILHARGLLTGSGSGAALAQLRRRYRILIIDEFQDTDFAQKEIAFAIGRGVPRPQLFLVGDPKQSIYRFRGADISVWNEVAAELHPDGEPLTLSRNFRTLPPVVEFVNAVSETAMEETGEAVEEESPESRVRYASLEPAREAAGPAGVEWIVPPDGGKKEARLRGEGERVAARILRMVQDEEPVTDPETGRLRPARYRDVAILFRTRSAMEGYEAGLARHGIPFYHAGSPRMAERQEIVDLLTALRLIENPRDDLRAFAFLRSPFVGLRDEVIARIRIEGGAGRPLLVQARDHLKAVAGGRSEWSPAREDSRIAVTERRALEAALDALDHAGQLAWRLPLDELVDGFLTATGYRLHLLLLDRHRETFPHLQAFLRLAEEHRDRPLGTFLDIWDRWDDLDLGLPRAALHSEADDVVTLSTIHVAKGLEWPVVFLADVAQGITPKDAFGRFLTDAALGPLLCPRKDDMGERGRRIVRRYMLEEAAESARLLYVATTRARDRLVIVGPREKKESYGSWLARGLGAERAPEVRVLTEAPDVAPPARPPAVELEWMDAIEHGEPDPLVLPRPEPPLRRVTSATELSLRDSDPEAWTRRYRHGVQASWEFDRRPAAGESGEGAGIPQPERGTIIHGALERYREERELAEILDEVIGELDAPELHEALAPGSRYRTALEAEIDRVVQSAEWAWYVEGEHHRELPFVHFSPGGWRMGAFDLYRPRGPSEAAAAGDPALDGKPRDAVWVIDFKTHRITTAEEAERTALDYGVQADVYRKAAGATTPERGDPAAAGEGAEARPPVRVRLHFTHPNEVVDVPQASG